MNEETLKSYSKRFDMLLKSTNREGAKEMIEWLHTTDFYTAPASTRYHGSYEGGLLEHSLDVYDWLVKFFEFFITENGDYFNENLDSIQLVALCHDFCKIGSYKTEMRWRKDSSNQWEQYPTYKFKEDFPFGGHGSKSVYLVQHFVRLKPHEAAAINCHMGSWDMSPYGKPSEVFEVNKLAWLLHVADEASTYNSKEV